MTTLATIQPHANGEIQTARENSRAMGVIAVTSAMEAMKAIRTFVQHELKEGHDFGTIPGAGDRKVLLQPGAQKVLAFYESYPDPIIEKTELGNGHVEFVVTTNILRFANAQKIGAGVGSCSTMESKYRFRNGKATCPKCGVEAINKSKDKPEFYCWKKQGGCGATYSDRDPAIVSQKVGKIENENPHDVRNTVLKMACKRSLVAASLALGCVSDLFTQDLDDSYDLEQMRSEPVTARPSKVEAAPPPFVDYLVNWGKEIGKDLVSTARTYAEKKRLDADPNRWTKAQKDAFVDWADSKMAAKAEAAPAEAKPAATADRDLFDNLDWLMSEANQWWRGHEDRERLGFPVADKILDSIFPLHNHLLKWLIAANYIEAPAKKDPASTRAALKRAAEQHYDAMLDEARRYVYEELPARKVAEVAQDEPGANG